MLLEEIQEAQQGNQERMLGLIDQFAPLLKKYAYRLGTEDAYQDMVLALIILINKLNLESQRNQSDGALVLYISKSMHHQYVSILKKEVIPKEGELSLDVMEDYQLPKQLYYNMECESGTVFDLLDSDNFSEQERQSIYMIFYEGYSVTELSKMKGLSRQNISQIKNRALQKLRCRLLLDSRRNGYVRSVNTSSY